ncbi:tRNA pseudouridine synthase A [Mesobacillus boroniphilus JCM 21738]|uniref:tRNA pseudouridine synthase A n=1 Tax=Mesobacillus boroniphilus JCM 21738 TaxID=1294265 RepID=W4RQU9_9BACI|nr:tRNA pseudouridine synthase A [Mesobacillus boroniphilus JCM 21738]
MPRIKCTISYDGTGFSGYQVQPGKRTVQGELEKALEKLSKVQASESVRLAVQTQEYMPAAGRPF